MEQHYWLFGEQYHLVTADKRMQKVLEEYLYLLYGDKAPNPVLTPDEEELRRMDIFACAARNTEDANGSAIQENLVVELKAPKVVLTKAVLRKLKTIWITSENNRCLIASTADGSLLLYVALLMTMSRHDTIPRSLKAKGLGC